MVEDGQSEVTQTFNRKRRPVVTMVPLFNWRTLIAVGIGAMVGALLGLAYWIISPFDSSGEELWQSSVGIQVVNPGSSYVLPRDLQQRGEYYATKANGFPFYEFLSQELSMQAPGYSRSVSELGQMISVKYNQNSITPVFNVMVSTPSSNETAFLVSKIPGAFVDYLVAEDDENRQKAYPGAPRQGNLK